NKVMKSTSLSLTAFIALFSASFVSSAPTAKLPFDGIDYPYGTSDVSVIKTTRREACGRSLCIVNFQVYLAVKNKSPTKQVGILYSQNSWESSSLINAKYIQPMDNDYELWQMDGVGGSSGGPGNSEQELAAFVEYDNDGNKIYDPRNNFFINFKPTPAVPIVFANNSLPISINTSNNDIRFSGKLHTYNPTNNPGAVGEVAIRWSVDNWETINENIAVAEGIYGVHKFDFVIGSADKKPEKVLYALRYKAADGNTYWNNNEGQNFEQFTTYF
ncbi:hypothetical protein HDV05_008635, partial [Chytridiales sp. JEL 0842]